MVRRACVSFVFLSILVHTGVAQRSSTSDPKALAIVQQSVASMGRNAPTDSLATGTIEVVEGSRSESGSIRILTRGHDQTVEDVRTDKSERKFTFSNNEVRTNHSRSDGDRSPNLKDSTELALGSQSPCFPLVLLASALRNPDVVFEYVVMETLNGAEAHHIRFRNTFQSKPGWQRLSNLTTRDVWIDAKSVLPVKVSYAMQETRGGGADSLRVDVVYSDYRDSGGFLYPFLIEKSLNGTLWSTIRIERVTYSNNFSDSDFRTK